MTAQPRTKSWWSDFSFSIQITIYKLPEQQFQIAKLHSMSSLSFGLAEKRSWVSLSEWVPLILLTLTNKELIWWCRLCHLYQISFCLQFIGSFEWLLFKRFCLEYVILEPYIFYWDVDMQLRAWTNDWIFFLRISCSALGWFRKGFSYMYLFKHIQFNVSCAILK